MFLIVVDAYSKWPEAFEMKSTPNTATINTLRTLFARQGIPAEIMSDNGPQFRSDEFRQFMESNAIRHITSSPFHPRTNGQEERFVQSFKKAIKSTSGVQLHQQETEFILVQFRITPQGTTYETPSILMYGRNIQTHLDIMKPDLQPL
jgi:transposase InsO family protein